MDLKDFYPRPPRGGRLLAAGAKGGNLIFLSTPSAGRATTRGHSARVAPYISIHALRGEGDIRLNVISCSMDSFLSTPSAGRATRWTCAVSCGLRISIHALRGEGDSERPLCIIILIYFYPRPPRGGRRGLHSVTSTDSKISIHALRGEGDRVRPGLTMCWWVFLSTPSAGRATLRILPGTLPSMYFYPRPPRGGRRVVHVVGQHVQNISIHALRGEGDHWRGGDVRADTGFLSTPSAGRATPQHRRFYNAQTISIHALRGEGDYVGMMVEN